MEEQTTKIEHDEFSVMLGGPLYQLFLKLRLQRPPVGLVMRRLIAIPTFVWLPLLLLSLFAGSSSENPDVLPFLYDFEAHARLLITLPCLIITEVFAHQILTSVVLRFYRHDLIEDLDRSRFEDARTRAAQLRDSTLIEVILIVATLTLGHFVWKEQVGLLSSSWYAVGNGSVQSLTAAGLWYVYISIPLFQFMLLRWLYRVGIWSIFLFKVSKLRLKLSAGHPDGVGGLAFISESTSAFSAMLFGLGALVSGVLANRILFEGASLFDFKGEIIGLVVIVLILVLTPLCFFIPQLGRLRQRGLQEYDLIAKRYVREFETKWLSSEPPATEPLLGSGDIQSLADLTGIYEGVAGINPVPFTVKTVITLAVITALPIAPLLLTVFSLKEIVSSAMEILL